MRRSEEKILTTHVGSLPGPRYGQDEPDLEAKLKKDVAEVVERQHGLGIDLINEGEYTKGGDWLSFMDYRFGGYEARDTSDEKPILLQGKDREEFADFYDHATKKGTLFYLEDGAIITKRPYWVCTGPVTYTGGDALAREISVFKEAVGDEEAFLTTTAPASLEVYRRDEYYDDEEAYLFAIADAMKVEYDTIAAAGLLVQVDDAWLPALWDRIGIQMGMEAFRKRCALRVEALNHALSDIPEEQIRYHLCWGSWHGPHAYDLELIHIVDIMLNVRAQAYLIEGANARHEHEYAVWDEVKLPDGKILIPGVVTHSTDLIEHPDLVAQRIQRYAERVGNENVIAGTDCGFGGRSHPQIAWAKLRALVEGAELASKTLY